MAMTYEEFKAFGQANCCNGGDTIVECWERSDFDAYVNEFGKMTKEAAQDLCKMYKEIAYGM